jgi:hypothetical protein
MKFLSFKRKSKLKSKTAAKLFDEAIDQVSPKLEKSINDLIENENNQIIQKAFASISPQFMNTNDTRQMSTPIQPVIKTTPLETSTLKHNSTFNLNNSANPDVLQSVMAMLAPYLENSIKTMMNNEKDLLIGTVIQNIQTDLNDKNNMSTQ